MGVCDNYIHGNGDDDKDNDNDYDKDADDNDGRCRFYFLHVTGRELGRWRDDRGITALYGLSPHYPPVPIQFTLSLM